MGVYLKNNPSSLTTIVSESILQYLIMLTLAICAVIPNMESKPKNLTNTLIEFKADINGLDIDKVLEELEDLKIVNGQSIIHIPRSEAMEIMGEEIGESMLNRMDGRNPFCDIIRFSTSDHTEIETFFSANSSIAGIYSTNASVSNENNNSGRFSRKYGIPLLIVSAILYYFYFYSFGKQLVAGNASMIKSLKLYGSENNYIRSLLNENRVKSTVLAWMISILLFILTIYLILGILGLGFADIGLGKLFAVVFITLLLTIVVKYLMINKAISTYNNISDNG